MGSDDPDQHNTAARSAACETAKSVCVRFWMNGCAQAVHVSAAGASRCRRDLLATGAVLLN